MDVLYRQRRKDGAWGRSKALKAGRRLIDDLTEPRRPTLEWKLDGPAAEYLTDILGLDPVTTGPMHFEIRVEPGVAD